jgi:carboxylate-amine ligase
MKKLPFKSSSTASLGIEFELQIINPQTFSLMSRAKDLIRNLKQNDYQTRIKPEITQSMIEINTSVHLSPHTMFEELNAIQRFLAIQAKQLNIAFCGGGTHPFQRWSMQKIFPMMRYKKLSRLYRHLSKRSTVFGQHIHVGCKNGEDALYLTHALSRYVPHFIAISASSPFYQGINTEYHSTRSTVFSAFPLSGVMPYLTTWEEFSNYFYKMRHLGIIETMKDFYWDIRPKPEFGTVEIRVLDMPLTCQKGIMLAAYLQALSTYLLHEKPLTISADMYHVYSYNRFQASRYGFDGHIIQPETFERCIIQEDILQTIKKIERYANQLNNMGYLSLLSKQVLNKENDTATLKELYAKVNSLPSIVQEQCKIWTNETNQSSQE